MRVFDAWWLWGVPPMGRFHPFAGGWHWPDSLCSCVVSLCSNRRPEWSNLVADCSDLGSLCSNVASFCSDLVADCCNMASFCSDVVSFCSKRRPDWNTRKANGTFGAGDFCARGRFACRERGWSGVSGGVFDVWPGGAPAQTEKSSESSRPVEVAHSELRCMSRRRFALVRAGPCGSGRAPPTFAASMRQKGR